MLTCREFYVTALIIPPASVIQYGVPYCPQDNSLWIHCVLRCMFCMIDGFWMNEKLDSPTIAASLSFGRISLIFAGLIFKIVGLF